MGLLERDGLLQELHGHAEAARTGGVVVLVAGEAGAGKSVLLERFQAELPDAVWAWGACDGLTTPRPLGPLYDLALTLRGPLLELCSSGAPREELFRALLDQVAGAGRPGFGRLGVIVVEDLHWADDATLDVVRFLARRIRSAPVLLVVTYRDDGLVPAAPLSLVLGELASLRWSRRVTVPPLTLRAVCRLANERGVDGDEVFALSRGNAFYATELVEAGARGVPAAARDAVLARAAVLSAEARRVLEHAALIGERFDLDVLVDATGCDEGLVEELLDSGLLVGDAEGLRFRHEIARRAVAERIAEHRRQAIHAATLSALLGRHGVPPDRLAFHADAAGDDAATLTHATDAAITAERLGSHREAVTQYRRALRAAERQGAPARARAALWSGLGRTAALANDWQGAADADVRSRDLWRALGEARGEADALRRLALALGLLCRGDEALVAAREAVARLEDVEPCRELAAACAALAAILMLRNDLGPARDLARRAQEVAQAVGAVDVLVDALDTEGCTSGEPADPAIRRALALALEQDLPSEAARAYCNLFGPLAAAFRFTEAEECYRAGLAYGEDHDLDSYAYFLRSGYTNVLLQRGLWDEALAMSRDLLIVHSTSPLEQICPSTRVGEIAARRGEPEAWPALDAALELAEPTAQTQYVLPVRLARAEAAWIEGDLERARREAEQGVSVAVAPDPWLAGAAATWLARTGSSLSLAVPGAEPCALAEPYALAAAGRHDDAARAWEALGCRYEAALALVDGAREDELRAALAMLDELGAQAVARRVRRSLREMGARAVPAGPRRATRENPFGLTEREAEVLTLVRQRLTNAQIAERLVVSTRTVDHHVSAILGKLGVERRELAAVVADRAAVPAGRREA